MKIYKFFIFSAAALSLAACGEHTHSFGEAWKSDDTSHWHECECGEKSDKADHLDTNIDGKCDVCNHDMEGPTPTGGEVTKDEWEAAFGLDKTFYFADNYKISMIMSRIDGEMSKEGTIDGNKLKKVSRSGGSELESYYSKEGNTYYQFTKSEDKWKKEPYSINPMNDFTVNLEPFENIDSFTYDSESGTYKCASLTHKETPITNLFIKFNNKRVVNAGFDANMGGADIHLEATIVYGGQTVTLPTVDPEPAKAMTQDEFNALVNKAVTKGFYFKTSAPQADCTSSTVIFDCVNKNLYVKEQYKDRDFPGITVYYNSVAYFTSPLTGEWQEPHTFSSEELENEFNAGLTNFLMELLPTTDFSDFTFNPDDGTYEVTTNLSPYEGVEITMVYVYVMDANGITSISGTTTYVFGGETQTSTISIYDVDIGEQEISAPF